MLFRTTLDLITPRLVFADLALFQALLHDLFPAVQAMQEVPSPIKTAVEAELRSMGLQAKPTLMFLLDYDLHGPCTAGQGLVATRLKRMSVVAMLALW